MSTKITLSLPKEAADRLREATVEDLNKFFNGEFTLISKEVTVSYKPEVIADSSGEWCGNALRFATREEAEANVRDLMGRWFAVRETRVVESSDPVNYRWVAGKGLEAV